MPSMETCDTCDKRATTVLQWAPGGKVQRYCWEHAPTFGTATSQLPAYLAQGVETFPIFLDPWEKRQALADLAAKNSELATLRADRDALAARVAALRPVVWRFAELMETRLQENDHKGGWSDMTTDELFHRLSEESQELFDHVKYRRAWTEDVGRQAADVANFALFIADVCGALAAPAPGATQDSTDAS